MSQREVPDNQALEQFLPQRGSAYRTAPPLLDEIAPFRAEGDDQFDGSVASPQSVAEALRLSVGQLTHKFFEDGDGVSAVYFNLLGFSPVEKEVTGAEIEYTVYDSRNRRVIRETRRMIATKNDESGFFFGAIWVKKGTFSTKKGGDSDFERFPEVGERDYVRLADAARTLTFRITAKVKRVFFADGTSVGTGRRGR